jgi:hypothetical protein
MFHAEKDTPHVNGHDAVKDFARVRDSCTRLSAYPGIVGT